MWRQILTRLFKVTPKHATRRSRSEDTENTLKRYTMTIFLSAVELLVAFDPVMSQLLKKVEEYSEIS